MIHEYKNTCTGSSKHILAPCTLHALDSSIGSDGSSQRTPCQPSKHAQLARSPCRVHVPCSQTGWQVGCSQAATSHPTLSGARAPAVARAVGRGERRLALRAAPAVAVAPESRRRDRRGACEPLAQCSWCHSSRRSTCTGPAPRTRRGPRTRPRTAARCVVTAPSVRARALARRRAVATSSTRTRDFDFLRTKLADSFPKPSNQCDLPLRQNTWRYHPVGQKSSGPYSIHCRMSIQQTTVLVSCGFDGGSSPGVNSRPLPAVA
jgi:hypothetical protein